MTGTTEDRLAALEAELQRLRDEREITRLVTAYGPLVDAGRAEEVAALWDVDGVYDVDEAYLEGADAIEGMVRSPGHQGWITGGCAHFLGPVHVTVDGDEAVGICHSLMIVHRDRPEDERRAPAEGELPGEFYVRRATAHHFTFRRTTSGWRTVRRTSRLLDGRAEARALLAAGALGRPAGQ